MDVILKDDPFLLGIESVGTAHTCITTVDNSLLLSHIVSTQFGRGSGSE